MKFIKNHRISLIYSPFKEMEILPLIETRKEAEEYASTMSKKVGYYGGISNHHYVPMSIVGNELFYIVLSEIDTYDLIKLNKNEEIEIKNGICSIKKKRVLDFYIMAPLFLALLSFAFFFIGIFICDFGVFTALHLLNSILLFYLGFSNYRKKNRSCKK